MDPIFRIPNTNIDYICHKHGLWPYDNLYNVQFIRGFVYLLLTLSG